MKRIAMLLVFVLVSMIPVLAQQDNGAQDKSARKEMTGTLCNAANVVETAGHATCDESKGGGSDEMVFIDDQGKATTIANPGKMKGMSGQKVKVNCEMKLVNGQNQMWIYDLQHIPSGM
ncbi:MAG TPA: hypothetical protein VKH81_17680 [Candidatus Angelobacter sp.]|nr:hypothetical protein [Candidatus Angelobacter sp.]